MDTVWRRLRAIYTWFQPRIYYRTLPEWTQYVELANSPAAYQNIIDSMFEDDLVNPGRLQVLEDYTEDVCQCYPQLTPYIWTRYHLKCFSIKGMKPYHVVRVIAYIYGAYEWDG